VKQRAGERSIYIFILELGTKTDKLIERRALNGPASKTPAFGQNVIALGLVRIDHSANLAYDSPP
jgi:hypothetical protein